MALCQMEVGDDGNDTEKQTLTETLTCDAVLGMMEMTQRQRETDTDRDTDL